MTRTARNIVEESLTKQRTDALWTANYLPVLPMTPQDFDIGALLPAILYMARWGHRRGKGKFIETFGQREGRTYKLPTIADVARKLVQPDSNLMGFNNETGQAILGDLLQAYCLENKSHALGHTEQIKRVFPTHYLASWLDLPKDAGHWRGVPELITTLLTQQKTGKYLESGDNRVGFSVGMRFTDNNLLKLFGRHMDIHGRFSDLNSDVFVEEKATDIGIDELLSVRMAQFCGSAPLKAQGGEQVERIFNRHPIANRAADYLREDLSIFIEVYGAVVPRQAFLQMLEAGIGLGMTSLLLSTASLLAVWETIGTIPEAIQQIPLPLFVDCSHGQDKVLRDLSEASTVECIRRYERLPLLMMLLRVLHNSVDDDTDLQDEINKSIPNALGLINFLGDIYLKRHQASDEIYRNLKRDCVRLAKALEDDPDIPELEISALLRNNKLNPILRLAEALCELMSDKQQRVKYLEALDSALMINQSNGLAMKRRVLRSQSGLSRRMDLRSIVLTTPLLEFLVHRHLYRTATESAHLSLQGFIKLLRDRYGLYIAQEPPGQPIPQEMLLRNKNYLERRLRDLGLLIGVNDAESMKQLKPHYRVEISNVA
jgi:hypothetical protein